MNDLIAGSLRSKTMWFNAAVTVAGIASAVSDHAGFVSFLVPGAGPYLAAIGAIGIGLRYLTNQSVRDKVREVTKNIPDPVSDQAGHSSDVEESAAPPSSSQQGDG